MTEQSGRIIVLNGTSSSGKTTLARSLRAALEPSFHYYASDQLASAGFRPLDSRSRLEWREAFFSGFHRSIAAFAEAGLNLLVEHIVEEQSWAHELTQLLEPFDVFWVGVTAPFNEIERREKVRGDRQIGEAREHLKTHVFCEYDIQVDTTESLEKNVDAIVKRMSHESGCPNITMGCNSWTVVQS